MNNQTKIRLKKILQQLEENREIVKYEATGNLKQFCEYNILRYKDKPIGVEAFLRLYPPIIQLDSAEKAELFHEMINTIKEDKYKVFSENVETQIKLLNYCASQYNEANKKKKSTSISEDRIVKKLFTAINQQKSNKKRQSKTSSLTYKELFVIPDHGEIIKSRLKSNEYINNEGIWIGHTRIKNELAILFHMLRASDNGMPIIKSGDIKNQIISFYKEFGLTVAPQIKDGTYCTIRNIVNNKLTRAESYENFLRIFSDLKNKEK